MEKLLTILGATGLVVSTSTILVSCNTNENTESLVKDITLILGTNDSKNEQTTTTIYNLNKTKILLRFIGEHISEKPEIKNEYVSVSLTQKNMIASISIKAISVSSTTIEVIEVDGNEDL